MSLATPYAAQIVLICLVGYLFSASSTLALIAPVQTIALGCHTITAEETAALKNAGAIIPSNGQFCDKDKPLLFGSCSDDPKAYLLTKSKQSADHVQGLNSDFACRLSKFLKASDNAGMKITLNSGYRSVERQRQLYAEYIRNGKRSAPVAPPGRSKHNYGLAYDLLYSGSGGTQNLAYCMQTIPSCKWAHENASKFGLRYPMSYEPWHIEPGTAVKGSEQLPADPNYWISDEGKAYSGAPMPAYQALPQPAMVNSIAPAPAASPATTPATSAQTQPQICTPEFSCTNNTMYYKTTSCTTQVYQTCPYGCGDNSCNLSTSTSATNGITVSTVLTGTSTATSTGNTNTNSNTNTGASSSTSISDLLNSYMNPTAVEIGTSTSISFILNPETGDIEQIAQKPTGSTLKPVQDVISSVQPVNGQQTFTSGDLSGSVGTYPGSAQTSAFAQVLQTMKNALLWALQTLRNL